MIRQSKDCTSCVFFTSYYDEYDQDESEPKWCGRCDIFKIDEKDIYIGEGYVCEKWRKI